MNDKALWLNNQLSKYIAQDIRNAIENKTFKYSSMKELAKAMDIGFENVKQIVYNYKTVRRYVTVAFIFAYCDAMEYEVSSFIKGFESYLNTVDKDD